MATASRRRATVGILQRRWRTDGDGVTPSATERRRRQTLRRRLGNRRSLWREGRKRGAWRARSPEGKLQIGVGGHRRNGDGLLGRRRRLRPRGDDSAAERLQIELGELL